MHCDYFLLVGSCSKCSCLCYARHRLHVYEVYFCTRVVNTRRRAALRVPFHPRARGYRLCVYAEGFQQGREMPSKIIFETEDQAMDEDIDTVAEVKPVKVSRAGRLGLERKKKLFYFRDAPLCFGNMWLNMLTG